VVDHLCLVKCSLRPATGWLCIPSSTIYEAVSKHVTSGMIMLPWELWGKRTSWIRDAHTYWPPGACLVSGLRTAAATQLQGPIVIWDFSTRAVESSRLQTESEHGTVPKVCYPIGMDLEQRGSSRWRRAQIPQKAFFGDGSLANQPFCESKLHGRGDSGFVMMEGEHSKYYSIELHTELTA
jgi:hypothetical protein